jgi:hypothetical protein
MVSAGTFILGDERTWSLNKKFAKLYFLLEENLQSGSLHLLATEALALSL